MSAYVRKSLITINAQFTPPGWEPFDCTTKLPNPLPPQPTAAEAVLTFTNLGGSLVTTTLTMTLGVDGLTWSVNWDSSASGAGPVQWVVFASGTVQAADQGQFQILANAANTF